MTDWRENLLPASIGGARFFCSEVRTRAGRRTSVRELPLRDMPAAEDLGRRGRTFSVSGATIGDDYQVQRDEVLAVLERAGPHRFVHPWRGEMDVVLAEGGAVEITESDREGGWARFSFEVAEVGAEKSAVKVTPATDAALTAAAAAAVSASGAELKKKLGLSGLLAAIGGAIQKVADALAKVTRKIQGALGLGQSPITNALTDLKANAYALAAVKDQIAAELNALIAAVLGLLPRQDGEEPSPYPGGDKSVRVDTALEVGKELAAIDPVTPPPYEGGPVDEDEQAVEAAVGKHARVASVVGVVELFATLELESTAAAAKVLSVAGALVEALIVDETTSDELFVALTDLKAALDAHLASLSTTLPSAQVYTPEATTAALLIAFALYGDPTRDLEVVGRNRLPDPNFVVGGEPLQVLIDG